MKIFNRQIGRYCRNLPTHKTRCGDRKHAFSSAALWSGFHWVAVQMFFQGPKSAGVWATKECISTEGLIGSNERLANVWRTRYVSHRYQPGAVWCSLQPLRATIHGSINRQYISTTPRGNQASHRCLRDVRMVQVMRHTQPYDTGYRPGYA